MSDEIREFHLDGKQLAFLVISGIGAAVVVFLCGVMVGRGVRSLPEGERVEAGSGALLTAPAVETGVSSADVPVATDGRTRKEKIPNENVTYPQRLTSATPEAVSEPLPAPKATAAAPPAAARATSPVAPATKEPVRGGFDVQVSTFKQRATAEDARKKLEARQYKAWVTDTIIGGQRFFRVRVGTFETEREANAVVERLKKSYKNSKVYPHS